MEIALKHSLSLVPYTHPRVSRPSGSVSTVKAEIRELVKEEDSFKRPPSSFEGADNNNAYSAESYIVLPKINSVGSFIDIYV